MVVFDVMLFKLDEASVQLLGIFCDKGTDIKPENLRIYLNVS